MEEQPQRQMSTASSSVEHRGSIYSEASYTMSSNSTVTSSTVSSPATPPNVYSSPSVLTLATDGPQPRSQLLDQSHLKPGDRASLLSHATTINMYRDNAKRTNNPSIQFEFANFIVEAAKAMAVDEPQRWEYLHEAERLLRQLSLRGHSEAQYYLGNMYAAGLLNKKGKNEFDKAFPLFVQATKHHHADASYRAAKCYEDGLGCKRDSGKAVQFYRRASTLSHPGAMYRLGVAQLNGELRISRNPRDGVKWLKRAGESATSEYPHALHELALLHERGVNNVVFVDFNYAVTLYAQAAEFGYAPSAFRLGECYEYGKLGCQCDPALSIHYYTIAAEQGHREACFALTAWYLVGSPNLLPQSDEQAYVWAHRAAQAGLPKAEYAMGYFTEVGIGITKNAEEALMWYALAAKHGEERAMKKIEGKPLPAIPPIAQIQQQSPPNFHNPSPFGDIQKESKWTKKVFDSMKRNSKTFA
ncbi:hypothetical protein INT44_001810 [Umbelopsis vinacea]|uniref:HCP-like protein n=1 Tax=Umbelopsis vinacea TaxID=44442 RepID=A0A8H7UEH7_9FUNG|nr:hypothetical protein INT44_001810 [Umbelopsis vinacea]KAI9277498.1 hypothetical protein BC943DRAFT_332667 [Umbelopsis sp. AD052]